MVGVFHPQFLALGRMAALSSPAVGGGHIRAGTLTRPRQDRRRRLSAFAGQLRRGRPNPLTRSDIIQQSRHAFHGAETFCATPSPHHRAKAKASSFSWRPFAFAPKARTAGREVRRGPQRQVFIAGVALSTCRPCRRGRRPEQLPWVRAVQPPEPRSSATRPRSKPRSAVPCASPWSDR
jgi:hypothetical protein